MNAIIAQINGQGVVNVILTIIVFGVIFWLLWWLLSYIAPPEPFAKVARVILAILAVVVVINCLLSIIGRGYTVHW